MPYWRLFYHMVWGTAGRQALITAEVEDDLHRVISAKAQELGAFVYAIGGMEEHVHLVASIPPRMALSDFIGQVKGNSSHFMTHGLAQPREFKWQHDYGVVSFGGKQLDMVVRYVRGQRQHHEGHTVIPFLERTEAEDPAHK